MYVIRRSHLARASYLAMDYKGWGNAGLIGWTPDVATARTWEEKSGAYKLLKRRADDIGPGAEVVEKPATPPAAAPAQSRRRLTKKQRALGKLGAPERAYHAKVLTRCQPSVTKPAGGSRSKAGGKRRGKLARHGG